MLFNHPLYTFFVQLFLFVDDLNVFFYFHAKAEKWRAKGMLNEHYS
jgi:hypothetical protein